MPNWVYNRITIRGGTAEERAALTASFSGDRGDGDISAFTFQSIIPRPTESDDDWYNWNTTNWGTKWDAGDVNVEVDTDEVRIFFNTAWAPPGRIFNEIANKFPTFDVEYVYEEEQGWGGKYQSQDGTMNKLKEWDVPDSHAEIVERGGSCYCEQTDSVFYQDCLSEKAKNDTSLTDRVREAAVSLGNGWEGTYEDLLAAASSLSKEPSHSVTN